MKLGLCLGTAASVATLGLAFAFGIAACATGNGNGNGLASEDGGTVQSGDGGVTEAPDPPHALGTIVLGESHSVGAAAATKSVPFVSFAFVPDGSAAGRTCGKKMGACEVTVAPDCSDLGGTAANGCETGEACVFDEDCKAACKAAPKCTTTCDTKEVCAEVKGKAKCVPKVDFNAGVISLKGDGMSSPITVRPPYATTVQGEIPYVPGGEIKVVASGAVDVGFDKFEDGFTATEVIQTSPSLENLDSEAIFGADDVEVGWKAGKDKIRISLRAGTQAATCDVDDSAGKFSIPRNVIEKVLSNSGTGGTGAATSLSLSIGRMKTDVRKDKKTLGSLDEQGITLPSLGFLSFTTSSTETVTFANCTASGTGYASCNGTCVNLLSNSANCGKCGKVCASSTYCSNGSCI